MARGAYQRFNSPLRPSPTQIAFIRYHFRRLRGPGGPLSTGLSNLGYHDAPASTYSTCTKTRTRVTNGPELRSNRFPGSVIDTRCALSTKLQP
jgi:hypothetical protein